MAKSDNKAGKSKLMISIGALSKATGVPVETLRTWENRYGFPKADRKPSGHRVYTLASMEQVKQVAHALSRGLKASDVMGASPEDMHALLQSVVAPSSPRNPVEGAQGQYPTEELLPLIQHFSADRLTRVLIADWARMQPIDFLEQRIAPLIQAVGQAWAEGRMDISHEHFLSERVGDILRMLRLRYEEKADGPAVVMASLPGESHALGLQMAALVMVAAGCKQTYLGTEIPLVELESLAHTLKPSAMALSVSIATKGPHTDNLIRQLRAHMPPTMALVVGGQGAPAPSTGINIIKDLHELDLWVRSELLIS